MGEKANWTFVVENEKKPLQKEWIDEEGSNAKCQGKFRKMNKKTSKVENQGFLLSHIWK